MATPSRCSRRSARPAAPRRRDRPAGIKRLRSWGETSEASPRNTNTRAPCASQMSPPPVPTRRWPPPAPSMTDSRGRPTLATGAVHGDRGPPRRRRLRARRDRRPLDRGGVRGLAGLLHQRRRRGRRLADRPARAGGGPRGRAAGGRRDRRLRRHLVPPPARRRAGQRPRAARAPRARDPDVPARTPCSRSTPRSIFYTDGGVNHTDHRAAGLAAVDAVYPAARNGMAFPWLARDGLAAQVVRRHLPVLVERAVAWVDVTPRSTGSSPPCAPTRASSRQPEQLEPRIRSWASEEGAAWASRRPRRSGSS